MKKQITRRGFLMTSAAIGAVGAAAAQAPGTRPASAARRGPAPQGGGNFKMFCVSDAHFGWPHPWQPPNEKIAEAMRGILEGHPDLDLFVDSGDAHHNNAPDEAVADWMDVIGNGCGPIPLLYCTGNHDGIGALRGKDKEVHACEIASMPARPYYSVDIKGIHIVSLPQLMWMSLSPEETLEWLKLDLDAAEGRTTIIVSHNAIMNTTRHHGDHGYRQLANTDKVLKLLRHYPNVILWMHGHNHSYEAMTIGGRMYVSNGRIGGFNPVWNRDRLAQENLGGIYVEVSSDSVVVKAYDGLEKRYFENFTDDGKVEEVLRMRTSLDPSAEPALCWGFGKAAPGVRQVAYRHYGLAEGAPRAEVWHRPSEVRHLNEDPLIETYALRTTRANRSKNLGGVRIEPNRQNEAGEDTTWGWIGNGVSFNPQSDTRRIVAPGTAQGRSAYYRVHPASSFGIRTWIEPQSALGGTGVRARLRAWLFDSERNELASWESEEQAVSPGSTVIEEEFSFDVASLPGIYADPSSDVMCQMYAELELSGMDDDFTDVRQLEVRVSRNGGGLSGVVLDGDALALRSGPQGAAMGVLAADFSGRSRVVFDLGSQDTRTTNLLVRERGVAWQVRNAIMRQDGGRIVVDGIRNVHSRGKAVVIAPMRRTESMFIARVEGLDRFALTPDAGDGWAQLESTDRAAGRLMVANAGSGLEVQGGRAAGTENGLAVVEFDGRAPVRVRDA